MEKKKIIDLVITDSDRGVLVIALKVLVMTIEFYADSISEEFSRPVYLELLGQSHDLLTKLDK